MRFHQSYDLVSQIFRVRFLMNILIVLSLLVCLLEFRKLKSVDRRHILSACSHMGYRVQLILQHIFVILGARRPRGWLFRMNIHYHIWIKFD